MSISPLPLESGKSAVKDKLNEIIEFLNSADLKPKVAPPPKPATWSQSTEKELGVWRPKDPTEPLGFWLDPNNFLQKREVVPTEAIEKWELEHSGE